MTRDEAIDLLVRHEVGHMVPERRAALLLDWWSIDAEDPDYQRLPEAVQAAIERSDAPDDPLSRLYDPLLQVAVRRSLQGVFNSYLQQRLASLGTLASVEGSAVELVACQCCGYLSIHEIAGCEICNVCFWEADCTTNPDIVSAANHMGADLQ